MARKKRRARRRVRRPPSAPPPQRAVPRRPVGVPKEVASPVPTEAEEDLGTIYAHVKRDLRRILVIAVLMFAAIYVSRFIVLG